MEERGDAIDDVCAGKCRGALRGRVDQDSERRNLLPPGWTRIDEVLVRFVWARRVRSSGTANATRPRSLVFVVARLKHVFDGRWGAIRLGRTSAIQHVSLRTASDEIGEAIEALAPEETLAEAGESGHHALAGGLHHDGFRWRWGRHVGCGATWCQRGGRRISSGFGEMTRVQRVACLGSRNEVDSELCQWEGQGGYQRIESKEEVFTV